MYTRCIHCQAALGANEEVEHFPIGQRLAFDAHRGRLWAVCPSCLRWNLTPIEERWEAIEECERLYRGTPLRYSTDHIGLARTRSSLELIRVGEPMRPEFAAWRYGDRFARRRRRQIVSAGVSRAIDAATDYPILLASVSFPVWIAGFGIRMAKEKYVERRGKQIVARVVAPDSRSLDITRDDLLRTDIVQDESDRWVLELRINSLRARLVDGAAFQVGALLLAERNSAGATAAQVRTAVDKIEWFKGPEGIRKFAIKQGGIAKLGYEQRLALEMALHEESERRALEGELADLERSWRDAEELAAIADNMFLPDAVTQWMQKHTSGRTPIPALDV